MPAAASSSRKTQTPLGQQARPAGDDVVALDDALDPDARVTLEGHDGGQIPALAASRVADGLADRVLGSVLECAREPQQLTAVARGGGDHGSQLHAARRHRSRLVEHDRVDATGRLQHLRPLDQDAELRSAARADEQRGGRGEAERTRAGDDQDGDRRRECLAGARAGEQPVRERGGGEGQHDRHEDRRNAIGETLDGCLACLRGTHESTDLRQSSVAADLRRPHDDAPAGVDRSADHGVARALLDRRRLAGQQRLIDRGVAFLDDPVGGDLLARADDEAIADAKLADGNPALLSVRGEQRDVLGTELEKRAQRRARAVPRTRLEEARRGG